MTQNDSNRKAESEHDIPRVFRDALEPISGGSVLDVATGVGNFVNFLRAGLADYDTITGIDAQEAAIGRARDAFDDEAIDFVQMDAARMTFPDDSFDTVSVMASLHHFEHLPAVMSEIRRVLKPGGTLIVAEMHADASSEAARTGIQLHQWAAAIDEAGGDFHGQTMKRDELIALIRGWDWQELDLQEWVETEVQVLEGEGLERLNGVIAHYMERAASFDADPALREAGDELRQRIRSHGLGQQPFVIAVGVPGP